MRRTKIRCTCCDKNLSDFESTRRSALTGAFLDICNKCIKDTGIETIDREDLPVGQDFDEVNDWEEQEFEIKTDKYEDD